MLYNVDASKLPNDTPEGIVGHNSSALWYWTSSNCAWGKSMQAWNINRVGNTWYAGGLANEMKFSQRPALLRSNISLF